MVLLYFFQAIWLASTRILPGCQQFFLPWQLLPPKIFWYSTHNFKFGKLSKVTLVEASQVHVFFQHCSFKTTFSICHLAKGWQMAALVWYNNTMMYGSPVRFSAKGLNVISTSIGDVVVEHHDPQRVLHGIHYINTSWWFQPIWGILFKMGSSSPGFGVKTKNIWNHHLVLWLT